jgi:molecular chaperone GrpE
VSDTNGTNGTSGTNGTGGTSDAEPVAAAEQSTAPEGHTSEASAAAVEPAAEPVHAAPPAAPADPLELMTAERNKLKDQLLRTAADFDNYRKRARKDIEDAARRGREDTLRELLPVSDNLERAIAASANAREVEGVIEGVRMVHKLFTDSLERIGVSRIPSVGERFDPTIHEAIQQVESDEHPPGTIVAELMPGYRLGDKLVRAAMVVVAKMKTIVS